MANVHQVTITGWITWDATPLHDEMARNPDLTAYLAAMSLPFFGLRIEYNTSKVKLVENQHGGRTTFVPYVIRGSEAIWSSDLITFVDLLEECGWVGSAVAASEDSDFKRWFDLHIHQPVPSDMRERLIKEIALSSLTNS